MNKQRRRSGIMIGIMLVGIIVSGLTGAQTTETEWERRMAVWKQKSADAYEFPQLPHTPEYSSGLDRVKAWQIPENLLKTISTPGLLETFTHYPFAIEILIFDSYQWGLEAQIRNFNGLRELFQRQDAGMVILEAYLTINPEKVTDSADWMFEDQMRLFVIEALLTQDAILSMIPQRKHINLLEPCVALLKAKQRFPYDYTGIGVSFVIMAKLMEAAQYVPFQKRLQAIPPVTRAEEKIVSGMERYGMLIKAAGGPEGYLFCGQEVLDAITVSAAEYLNAAHPAAPEP